MFLGHGVTSEGSLQPFAGVCPAGIVSWGWRLTILAYGNGDGFCGAVEGKGPRGSIDGARFNVLNSHKTRLISAEKPLQTDSRSGD